MLPRPRFIKPTFGHPTGSTKLALPHCKQFYFGVFELISITETEFQKFRIIIAIISAGGRLKERFLPGGGGSVYTLPSPRKIALWPNKGERGGGLQISFWAIYISLSKFHCHDVKSQRFWTIFLSAPHAQPSQRCKLYFRGRPHLVGTSKKRPEKHTQIYGEFHVSKFFLLSSFCLFCLSFASLPLLFDISKPKKVPTRWGLWHIFIVVSPSLNYEVGGVRRRYPQTNRENTLKIPCKYLKTP